ncbi:hypothetical protein SPAR19_0648 [Streptococcus pneumoniae GA11184]|nr:hypothetical protein SPAR19_0648 [Streptococcus pneumoniae GA11184]
MDKQYLHEKLDAMRQNFVESTYHERAVGVLDQAHMSKKMLKIKKKLVALEMERCQRKIEHKDCSKIDQKIKEQKEIFESCCKKIKEDVRGITDLPHPIFTGLDCLKYNQ